MSVDDAAGGSAQERTFDFDASSGEVTGPSGTARLAPQPSALLTLLLERRGEVVARDEIRDLLWPAGGVDVDQGIAFALREVRKALETAGCDPAVVETIPRRGYRLLAEPHGPVSSGTRRDADVPPLWRRSRVVASVGIVGVLAALVLAVLAGSPSEPVVVIMEHRSETGSLDAFAAELGTTLTTVLTDSLAGVAGIVGPTGAGSLAGPDDVEGARERLGACLVVSGSVAPRGPDSVVVFTQMVRTADRVHVWARLDTVAVASAVREVVPAVLQGARESVAGC